MRIAFYTPFYKNSDFMPHMAEHCVFHPRRNNPLYNGHVVRIDWHLRGEVSYFDYESDIMSDDIKQMIYAPISQQVVDYESAIFQEEFWSMSYMMRVFEKLAQEIKDPQRTLKPKEYYSLEDIVSYHETYYMKWRYIILDEDKEGDNIVEANFDIIPAELPEAISSLEYKLIYLEWEKNFFIVQKWKGVYDLYFFVFLWNIFRSWDAYHKRYLIKSYYTHGPTKFSWTEYNALRINAHTDLNIDKEYFLIQKKYFIDGLKKNYFPKDYAESLLYFQQRIDFDLLATMLEEISYEYFMDNIVAGIKSL